MPGPLSGVTLIEMAGIGPLPFAGMMLADMGADVIRVDRIPSADGGDLAAMMRNDSVVDRGRRSLALDLKKTASVQIVLDLVENADALIEGFRPSVMEKLGLGPSACRQRNPRLVYGRMTGWGQTGPLAQAAGHDLNYIALAGALHGIGPADRPPPPPLNLVGDYGGGGMLLALGVVAALLEARQSNQGQVIDAAMTDGAAALLAPLYGLLAKGCWRDGRGTNFIDGSAHFYAAYECADGKFISVGAIEPQFYRLLLERCGIADRRFDDQWSAADWPELKRTLAALFLTRDRDTWCRLLEGTDACVAPVLDMAEAPSHPHNAARGTFIDAGGTMQPAPAPRFERTASELPRPAPAVGADTRALLMRLGRSQSQIQALIETGAAYAPPEKQ